MKFTKATTRASIIAVIAISLLFLIIPITAAFVISYFFVVISIACTALILCLPKKDNSNAITHLADINTSIIYCVVSLVFSVVAYLAKFSGILTFVIHSVMLAVFAIRLISISAGGNYINVLDKNAKAKHEEFNKERGTYWNITKGDKK